MLESKTRETPFIIFPDLYSEKEIIAFVYRSMGICDYKCEKKTFFKSINYIIDLLKESKELNNESDVLESITEYICYLSGLSNTRLSNQHKQTALEKFKPLPISVVLLNKFLAPKKPLSQGEFGKFLLKLGYNPDDTSLSNIILSNQQYKTALEKIKPFPIISALINRFLSPKKALVQKLLEEFFLRLGYNSGDTIVLDDLKTDEFSKSFRFCVISKDPAVEKRLSFIADAWFDRGPEIIIRTDEEQTRYFYELESNMVLKLKLYACDLKNPSNGNKLHCRFSPYDATFKSSKENISEYSFSIYVERPDSIMEPKSIELDNYVFQLRNEKELEKYLLDLTAPISIDEVYKKLCELSLGTLAQYPSIVVTVEKKVDNEWEIISFISLDYGETIKFTKTKNGITGFIDKNSQWVFNTSELLASNVSPTTSTSCETVKNVAYVKRLILKNKKR